MSYFLSVIVPTRERCDTLFYTLRTLVDQECYDCEFIVSDNHSNDGTELVVRSFSDPRIKYIKTPSRLSMSGNWEFALRQASGDYVTVIGDDDGFVPRALGDAMDIVRKYKSDALVWEKAEYCWPDYLDQGMHNWFSVKNKPCSIGWQYSKKKLKHVMCFTDGYSKLPCLYNSIVKKSLIDNLVKISERNVFFDSMAPDVFSAFALSQVIDKYLLTDYPFSINGASKHSNGTSFTKIGVNSSGDSPAKKFLSENTVFYDDRILLAPSVKCAVVGEYLQVKKSWPQFSLPDPDWKGYLGLLVKEAESSVFAKELLESAGHTARALGIQVPTMSKGLYIKNDSKAFSIGFGAERFNFYPPKSMVSNIYDACTLLGGMLPSITDVPPSHCLVASFNRTKAYLISELKLVYRNI